MRHRPIRRARATRPAASGLIAVAVVCGLGLPGQSAAHAATPPVSDAVAAALALAAGPAATVDDSAASECMGIDPEPLVYTTNRVVLRTSASVTDARRIVRRALTQIGSSAQVGPIEKITLPTLADDTSITPVLSVTLHAQPPEPVPIVILSRHLRSHHGMPASPDYFQSQSGGPVGMWPEGFPAPTRG